MVDPDGWILTTPRWDEKLKASLRAPWLPVTILKEGDAELQAPVGKG